MDQPRPSAPTRGIYLVANEISSEHCHNLIFTIRQTGCRLPIRILPYGGELLRLNDNLGDVKLVRAEDFPADGRAFVADLNARMRGCNPGLLNRFYAWFGEFDEFIYSDNDIVALMNWEELFPYLQDQDIVHADQQHINGWQYNFRNTGRFLELFGPQASETALNAGHFVCRRAPKQLTDLQTALAWMEANPEVPFWHDQALLCIAILLGNWRVLNLCRPPHNFGNSSAGHYTNIFDLFRTVQARHQPVTHIHFAGYHPIGTKSIDELIFAQDSEPDRNRKLFRALLYQLSGMKEARRLSKRARQEFRKRFRK